MYIYVYIIVVGMTPTLNFLWTEKTHQWIDRILEARIIGHQ